MNDFDDMRLAIGMHGGTPLRIDYVRNGQQRSTTLTPEREDSEFGPVGRAGIRPYLDTTVGRVKPGSPAAMAGLHSGDRIVAVNGHPVSQLTELDTWFDAAKKSAIVLDVVRGTAAGVEFPLPQRFRTTLPTTSDASDPYRGFIPPTEVHKLSFIPAVKDSVEQNWKMLRYAFITLGRLFRAEGSVKELSGPISIARISGEMLRRGWMNVIALMAMISLQLGIMNLLPIPVLDGGHIMILLVEGVARRDLSLRVKERIQQVGFAVLAALMIVVIYNDVITNVMRKG
jgi:regulator of sigma E protease